MTHSPPVFSLLQVTKSIQKTLSERYGSAFWVRAEMNKLNHYSHSGHCYPELVEKSNGKIIAQVNATMWKADYDRANQKFLSTLQEPLKDGIKILFLAKITFDPAHGLSLRILEIDPSYTLGDLEREKADTIARLRNEQVFANNKNVPFPMLPQRIAIISVETSKGYADFLSVIAGNQWGYKFFHHLFPSILQGEKAIEGINAQLRRIRHVAHHFDVVAIIRGGGGDVGLSCYNSYDLAKEIAQFPIPVLTGIGHATNETVAEIVSHTNTITPTKLADFLLQHFHDFAFPVAHASQIITDKSKRLLAENRKNFNAEIKLFKTVTGSSLQRSKHQIVNLSASTVRQSQFRFRHETMAVDRELGKLSTSATKKIADNAKQLTLLPTVLSKDFQLVMMQHRFNLDNSEKNISNMSPINVLKRGYSISLHKGKAITDATLLKTGDHIETLLAHGRIESVVTATKTDEI